MDKNDFLKKRDEDNEDIFYDDRIDRFEKTMYIDPEEEKEKSTTNIEGTIFCEDEGGIFSDPEPKPNKNSKKPIIITTGVVLAALLLCLVGFVILPKYGNDIIPDGVEGWFNKETTTESITEIETYILSYDANGGSDVPDEQNGKSVYKVSSKKPIREGYDFLGWADKEIWRGVKYYGGEEIELETDTTLYAVWSKIEYKLRYDANGGENAPEEQAGAYIYNISSTKPTRNGYSFVGWSDSKSASESKYDAGQKIELDNDTVLYAVWKKLPVSIKLSSNKGTINWYEASISLDDKHIELDTGYFFYVSCVTEKIVPQYAYKTITFTATVNNTDNPELTVESSNKNIAYCEAKRSGNVTTFKVYPGKLGTLGSAKITVKSKADSSVSAVFDVTVTADSRSKNYKYYILSGKGSVLEYGNEDQINCIGSGTGAIRITSEYGNSIDCTVTVTDPKYFEVRYERPLKAGPDDDYSTIGTVPVGASLWLIDVDYNPYEKMVYGKVNYNGDTGWIAMYYFA